MKPTTTQDPVTMMITDRVKPSKVKEYEAWVNGIHNDAKQFTGFLSVDVIRPQDLSAPEYIALVKFDNHENLKKWLDSANVAKWVAKLPDLLVTDPHMQQATGMELWFSRPKDLSAVNRPVFWKQVVVGVVTVYPLILLLNFLLSPLVGGLPKELSIFVVVVVLSGLLTYPVMPFATRLLHKWLYAVKES